MSMDVTYIVNFGHPLHASVVASLAPAAEVRVPFDLELGDRDTSPQVV